MSVPVLALAVSVADLGWQVTTTNYPGHEGHKFAQQTVVLDTGRVRYAVKYCSDIDPSLGEGRAWPTEGYIGMPMPTSENWYHSGFLFVRFNGVDIGSYRVKAVRVVETGERGAVDFFWDAEPGLVRVRFLALPGDDKILCEVAIQPRGELRSFSLLLRAYPSYFTAWHKVRGRRTLITAKRVAHEGKRGPTKVEIGPDENWLLLCDEVFDPAKGKGRGPCAVLFLPEQISKGTVELTNYPVTVRLNVKRGVRAVRLALWEFPDTPNEEALSRLRASAPKAVELLRKISFLPRPLLDAASKVEEARALLRRLPGWPKAGELSSLAGRLAEAARALEEGERKGAPDLRLEDEALSSLSKFEKLLWEARFEELFAE